MEKKNINPKQKLYYLIDLRYVLKKPIERKELSKIYYYLCFVFSKGQLSGGDGVTYDFNMASLADHLKKQSEQGASTHYNIEIIKYEVGMNFFSLSTLYTLTSVCIFSILFSRNFLRCCWGESVLWSRASLVIDCFLYSHGWYFEEKLDASLS